MAPDPLERVTLKALVAAARRGLAPPPEPVTVEAEHIAPIRASVRDAVEILLVTLPAEGAITFRALVAGLEDKLEIIVRFLAVLELFKQGLVDMHQTTTFGDLAVSRLAEGDQALDAVSLDDWDEAPAARRDGEPEVDLDEVDLDEDDDLEVEIDVAAGDETRVDSPVGGPSSWN
jgi:segregation and condensation protein A